MRKVVLRRFQGIAGSLNNECRRKITIRINFPLWVLCASVVIILFLDLSTLHAAGLSEYQAGDVTIVYEASLKTAALQLADSYLPVKKSLEKIFNWPLDFRTTVVLVKEHQQFQAIAGTDLVVAFAVPKRNMVVIDYSKMNTAPFTLTTTFQHELCHLLLHHYIQPSNLPRWLDEGVCQWASDGLAEVIMDQQGDILSQAVLTGRYLPLTALTERFPDENRKLQLAYAQSKSFVEFISREFGKDGLLNLLNRLKDGRSLEEAVQASFSISFNSLEKNWISRLQNKNTWLAYFTVHIYEIVFFIGALIVIAGFVRLVFKKKAYGKEEED